VDRTRAEIFWFRIGFETAQDEEQPLPKQKVQGMPTQRGADHMRSAGRGRLLDNGQNV